MQSFGVDWRQHEDKPRIGISGSNQGILCAGIFIVSKRGGAAKAVLATRSDDRRSLVGMFRRAEQLAVAAGSRKLYYLHPVTDGLIIGMLREIDYTVEGCLREPYFIGRDMVVMAKFLVASGTNAAEE